MEAVPAESVCLEQKSTAYKRKMRVWKQNRSHTRIDAPRGFFTSDCHERVAFHFSCCLVPAP